ncbi:MAG TPA: GtrA family protein [Bryobacteraceae bacterium]|nr:GtrA family protein [Bryobacteraceae bacterium]
MTPRLSRWLKFNAVGVIGAGVQLVSLALLVSLLRVNYLAATALAVETAVLHNFVWHERFTWRKRGAGGVRGVAGRLFRFHVSNGLVSILSNVVLMRLLVGRLHVEYLLANILTIGACSLLNFALGEWFVFRP